MAYSLSTVLAVAKKHCFYDQSVAYPPDVDAVEGIVKQSLVEQQEENLTSWPLLHKKSLYSTIQRLVNDTSAENTYRQGVYASITGGGRGSQPLFFATDVYENRRQRAEYGKLLASTGILQRHDWVIAMNNAGGLYRALDLVLEVVECAGACSLSAGSHMPMPDVLRLLIQYQANVVAGTSSQVVSLASHLSALAPQDRAGIRLDKIIYTSEMLTAAQRAHIRATLGDGVAICSMLASAETGPWAVSCPDLTAAGGDHTSSSSSSDFVYDTRTMAVEVFPAAAAADAQDGEGTPPLPRPLPDGETGVIVQTSLCRLRNPLVRYVSGDVGSLHALPESARARVPAADWPFLRVLRLEGRDGRFSFNFEGSYIEFRGIAGIVERPDYGILQWQVVLENSAGDDQGSLRPRLEVRMLPGAATGGGEGPLKDLVDELRSFIGVAPSNEDRFAVVFLESMEGFEKSKTGGKVIKFIDRVS